MPPTFGVGHRITPDGKFVEVGAVRRTLVRLAIVGPHHEFPGRNPGDRRQRQIRHLKWIQCS
jgi:hypothetical protein